LEKTFCSLTQLLNHRKSIRPYFAAALARSPKLSLSVCKHNNFETLMSDADHDAEDDALAANIALFLTTKVLIAMMKKWVILLIKMLIRYLCCLLL
jgi:hypothetical protein